MAVSMTFGKPAPPLPPFPLRHPMSVASWDLWLHALIRIQISPNQKIVRGVTLVPAKQVMMGGWARMPTKLEPVAPALNNTMVIGWAHRHEPVDMAFAEWAFAEFACAAKKEPWPKNQAIDGWWNGTTIYSNLQMLWKTWHTVKPVKGL